MKFAVEVAHRLYRETKYATAVRRNDRANHPAALGRKNGHYRCLSPVAVRRPMPEMSRFLGQTSYRGRYYSN